MDKCELTERSRALLKCFIKEKKPSFLARLALKKGLKEARDLIYPHIAFCRKELDGSDFKMAELLRAYFLFKDSGLLDAQALRDIRRGALRLTYRNPYPHCEMSMTSENHRISFLANEFLTAQEFPRGTFDNDEKSARWHRQKAKSEIERWIMDRARFGFSEWDSNHYMPVNLEALLNLYDFSQDRGIKCLAELAIHKILADMVIDSFRGLYTPTHGRTYWDYVKDAKQEMSRNIFAYYWDLGKFNTGYIGPILATSSYRPPEILGEIASDTSTTYVNKERHLYEGNPESPEQASPLFVNKYTYRTPSYMLSAAQDFLPGSPGQEHHIWQATLGHEAIVFTNHPGSLDEISHPNYWIGNGSLPRIFQYENLLIAIYNIPKDHPLDFTHAYFPRGRFDEITRRHRWVFARKGRAYIALTSIRPGGRPPRRHHFSKKGPYRRQEIKCRGRRNAWVCQLGSREHEGSFRRFRHRVAESRLRLSEDLELIFNSPYLGTIRFGWQGPAIVNSKEIALGYYPHFHSPYTKSEFGSGEVLVEKGDKSLCLDFPKKKIKIETKEPILPIL